MKCPKCGEEIPEGKKFCGFCGANLTDIEFIQEQADELVVGQVQLEEKVVESKGEVSSVITGFGEEMDSSQAEIIDEFDENVKRTKKKKRQLLFTIFVPILVILLVVTAALIWFNKPDQHSESIEVWVNCKDLLGEDHNFVAQVGRDQDVILFHRWLAVTRGQVQEYMDNVDHTVYLDNEIVTKVEIGAIESYTGAWPDDYPDMEGGYVVKWRWDVGRLSLGTHQVSFSQHFNADVFDGVDTFYAGDEWEGSCEIVVER